MLQPMIDLYHEAIAAGSRPGTTDSPVAYICRRLSLADSTVRDRLRRAELEGWLDDSPPAPTVQMQPIEETDEPFDEFLARRLERARQARQIGRNRFVDFTFRDDNPIGLLLFGDPHLDDDHCDLLAVQEHMEATHEDGVYGINLGDVLNNWVGRLERLHAHQSTTADRGWELAEWMVHGTRWLAQISGNHDDWSGHRDPMRYIARGATGAYIQHGARLRLRFPSGAERRVHVRHQFRGRSVYNDTHGPLRELLTGCRDHVAAQGHLHMCAHLRQVDPDAGHVMHAVQVGSFKRHDAYAEQLGLPDKNVAPSALVVIDPRDDGPEGITVWMDALGAGLSYLRAVRGVDRAA